MDTIQDGDERAGAPAMDPGSPSQDGSGARRQLSAAASIAKAFLGAAATVVVRVLALGFAGFFLGILAFFVERGSGLLDLPCEPWRYLVYLLLPAYAGAGAFLLGQAGLWRGIGRAAMDLVGRHGLSRHVLERIFERLVPLATGASTPELLRKPIPLQRIREALRQASDGYAASDDLEGQSRGLSRAVARRLRRWVCRLVEARLLEIVGEQEADRSVSELALQRLQELAEWEIDGRVIAGIDRARGKKATLWMLLAAAVAVLPPLVLLIFR